MKKKITKGMILSHFAKENVFDKVQKVMDESKMDSVGLKFNSINFSSLNDPDPDATCTDFVTQFVKQANGTTRIERVCIEWSDGQDHSND